MVNVCRTLSQLTPDLSRRHKYILSISTLSALVNLVQRKSSLVNNIVSIMENLKLALILTVFIGVVQCSFNPYPRYSEYYDGGDTGDPIFLTEYIESGQFELAKNLSLVNHDDMKWVPSYAGYLTVNKSCNSNMFFWFFPAKLEQSKAPVVLWLQGGPGASSLFGLFTENGPFFVTSKKKLQPRKYSWHLNHNLLYIDNPVG